MWTLISNTISFLKWRSDDRSWLLASHYNLVIYLFIMQEKELLVNKEPTPTKWYDKGTILCNKRIFIIVCLQFRVITWIRISTFIALIVPLIIAIAVFRIQQYIPDVLVRFCVYFTFIMTLFSGL
jgi:hypothetical protein